MSTVAEIVDRCRSYDDEPEWFDFKQGTAVSKPDDIGILYFCTVKRSRTRR